MTKIGQNGAQQLYARNLKHKLSVWMKEGESLGAAEHEEEVHMMCEPEQGVYLGEEEENVDTKFTDKLMNMENIHISMRRKRGMLMRGPLRI